MKLMRFISWCAVALGVALSSRAADPAAQIVEAAVGEVLAVVYDQPATDQPLSARVRPVLEKYFDFDYATRSAVGLGWKKFSAEEQARTIRLFADLVIRTYADRFDPGPKPVIAYGRPIQPADKRREIPTTVTYAGQNYAIGYKLRETPTGWLIYDVVIENVSMIANYRAQFDELVRKGGAKALVQALEEKLREVTAQPSP